MYPSSSEDSQPNIEDTSSFGGWVWIVLFGWVMLLSLVANVALCAGILTDKRKRASVVHQLLVLMFVINVCDYALLTFEFSLGVEHTFPYSANACRVWQVALRTTPVLQATAVALLIYVTARNFIFGREMREAHLQNHLLRAHSRSSNHRIFIVTLLVLGFVPLLLVGVPTAAFARLVKLSPEDEANYCEVDFSNFIAEEQLQRLAVNIYYITYSSVLSYWLPLLISLPGLIRLLSPHADSTKYPEISLSLATGVSFFLFYVLHACVVATRHSLDLVGLRVSTYHEWMLKVIQSLFWLLAYFWHFARPSLVILLDPDLKETVLYSPSKIWRARDGASRATDSAGQDDEERSPIVKVSSRPVVVAAAVDADPAPGGGGECQIALIPA